MFSETTGKVLVFIALVIIGCFLYRIIINYNKNNNDNIFEGLTSSKDDDDDDDDDDTDSISDEKLEEMKKQVNLIKQASIKAMNGIELNKPGIRELYEDILKYMDTYVGAKIFQNIALYSLSASQKDSKAGEFKDEGTVKLVKKINMMSEFHKSIQSNLTEWLDNQDSGTSKSNTDSGNSSMW
jgi:hypothetical protein